jgi:hypothetical protein
MARTFLLVGLFGLAAVLTAQLLEIFLPFPQVPQVGARLRYFAERKDNFDTVFIGSSRIRHQIIPELFDQETALRGLPTHSFNLGYSGMWPPESFYLLRRVLALHPRKLRYAVIELMDYRFGETEFRRPTLRMLYWHDWRHTAMAGRAVVESSLLPGEKYRLLLRHSALFSERLFNPGRAADWLVDRYFPSKFKEDSSWQKRRGFDPEMEDAGVWTDWARADFVRQVDALRASLTPQTARPGFASALRDLIADLRRAGVKPLFVIAPTLRVSENLVNGLPEGITVSAFNHPDEYPHLYLLDAHADARHLNMAGAVEFTRLVADRFGDRVGRD